MLSELTGVWVIKELLLKWKLEQLTQVYEDISIISELTPGKECNIKLMSAQEQLEFEKGFPNWLRRLKRSFSRRVTQLLIKTLWEAQQKNRVFRGKGLAALLDRLVDEGAALDIVKYRALMSCGGKRAVDIRGGKPWK